MVVLRIQAASRSIEKEQLYLETGRKWREIALKKCRCTDTNLSNFSRHGHRDECLNHLRDLGSLS